MLIVIVTQTLTANPKSNYSPNFHNFMIALKMEYWSLYIELLVNECMYHKWV